jgi:hypothetical protein
LGRLRRLRQGYPAGTGPPPQPVGHGKVLAGIDPLEGRRGLREVIDHVFEGGPFLGLDTVPTTTTTRRGSWVSC